MKRHKINIKLIKLYVSTILKLPNTQLSHEKNNLMLITYHYTGCFSIFIGILKKMFTIIPKIQPKQPVSCSFAQLSSTIQSKSFTPSTAPPGRNLQLKGYRRTPTELVFSQGNPRNPKCGNTNSASYSTK